MTEYGGSVIDSSPMYGTSEQVIGDLSNALSLRPKLFMATKVWTSGKDAGIAQMRESFRKLRVNVMDLMQIHNLLDWRRSLVRITPHLLGGGRNRDMLPRRSLEGNDLAVRATCAIYGECSTLAESDKTLEPCAESTLRPARPEEEVTALAKHPGVNRPCPCLLSHRPCER